MPSLPSPPPAPLSFPPLTHLGRIIEDAPAHLDPLLPLPRRQILLRLRLRDVVQAEVVRPRRRALVGPGLDGELDVPLDRQPPLEDGIHPAVRGGHLPDGGGGAEHTYRPFWREGWRVLSLLRCRPPIALAPSAEMMLLLLMILLYVVW